MSNTLTMTPIYQAMTSIITTLLILQLLLPTIITTTNADEQLCSCSPSIFTFRLDFSQTCPPTNVVIGSTAGIDNIFCEIREQPINDDDPMMIFDNDPLIPEVVYEITIFELGLDLSVIDQSFITGVNLVNGNVYTYESTISKYIPDIVGPQEKDIPGGLQIQLKGLNSMNKVVVNDFILTYTNNCNVAPFEVGDSIGWNVFDAIEPPPPILCPFYLDSDTPSGAPSHSSVPTSSVPFTMTPPSDEPTIKPTKSPRGPRPPTRRPTTTSPSPSTPPTDDLPEPSDEPSEEPTNEPSEVPSDESFIRPSDEPSGEPSELPSSDASLSPSDAPSPKGTERNPTANPVGITEEPTEFNFSYEYTTSPTEEQPSPKRGEAKLPQPPSANPTRITEEPTEFNFSYDYATTASPKQTKTNVITTSSPSFLTISDDAPPTNRNNVFFFSEQPSSSSSFNYLSYSYEPTTSLPSVSPSNSYSYSNHPGTELPRTEAPTAKNFFTIKGVDDLLSLSYSYKLTTEEKDEIPPLANEELFNNIFLTKDYDEQQYTPSASAATTGRLESKDSSSSSSSSDSPTPFDLSDWLRMDIIEPEYASSPRHYGNNIFTTEEAHEQSRMTEYDLSFSYTYHEPRYTNDDDASSSLTTMTTTSPSLPIVDGDIINNHSPYPSPTLSLLYLRLTMTEGPSSSSTDEFSLHHPSYAPSTTSISANVPSELSHDNITNITFTEEQQQPSSVAIISNQTTTVTSTHTAVTSSSPSEELTLSSSSSSSSDPPSISQPPQHSNTANHFIIDNSDTTTTKTTTTTENDGTDALVDEMMIGNVTTTDTTTTIAPTPTSSSSSSNSTSLMSSLFPPFYLINDNDDNTSAMSDKASQSPTSSMFSDTTASPTTTTVIETKTTNTTILHPTQDLSSNETIVTSLSSSSSSLAINYDRNIFNSND